MKVAAIIPAYNEEKTIAGVVRIANRARFVSEVLVVSDGSTDHTPEIARECGARVVELSENMGKGRAMCVGIQNTDADVFLFLDADLIGLHEGHIRDLVKPVLDDTYDMVIGIFGEGRMATDLAMRIAPWLSGQRAVRRKFLEAVDLDITRFGAEAALTKHVLRQGARVKEARLRDLTHVMKEEKLGFVKGFVARLKMYWEIAKQARPN